MRRIRRVEFSTREEGVEWLGSQGFRPVHGELWNKDNTRDKEWARFARHGRVVLITKGL